MKREIITIIICWLSFWALPAHAALVTIQITAEIDDVYDPYGYLGGKIKVGDTITGRYIYDSSTPDQDWLRGGGVSSPTVGRYHYFNPPYGISLTAGGFVFQTDPAGVNFLVGIVNDNDSGDDIYYIDSYNNLPLSNGVTVGNISWYLNDPTGHVFSNDALPISAPILDDWGLNFLSAGGGGGRATVFAFAGHVTAAELVPEPGTILLLTVGSLLLRKRK